MRGSVRRVAMVSLTSCWITLSCSGLSMFVGHPSEEAIETRVRRMQRCLNDFDASATAFEFARRAPSRAALAPHIEALANTEACIGLVLLDDIVARHERVLLPRLAARRAARRMLFSFRAALGDWYTCRDFPTHSAIFLASGLNIDRALKNGSGVPPQRLPAPHEASPETTDAAREMRVALEAAQTVRVSLEAAYFGAGSAHAEFGEALGIRDDRYRSWAAAYRWSEHTLVRLTAPGNTPEPLSEDAALIRALMTTDAAVSDAATLLSENRLGQPVDGDLAWLDTRGVADHDWRPVERRDAEGSAVSRVAAVMKDEASAWHQRPTSVPWRLAPASSAYCATDGAPDPLELGERSRQLALHTRRLCEAHGIDRGFVGRQLADAWAHYLETIEPHVPRGTRFRWATLVRREPHPNSRAADSTGTIAELRQELTFDGGDMCALIRMRDAQGDWLALTSASQPPTFPKWLREPHADVVVDFATTNLAIAAAAVADDQQRLESVARLVLSAAAGANPAPNDAMTLRSWTIERRLAESALCILNTAVLGDGVAYPDCIEPRRLDARSCDEQQIAPALGGQISTNPLVPAIVREAYARVLHVLARNTRRTDVLRKDDTQAPEWLVEQLPSWEPLSKPVACDIERILSHLWTELDVGAEGLVDLTDLALRRQIDLLPHREQVLASVTYDRLEQGIAMICRAHFPRSSCSSPVLPPPSDPQAAGALDAALGHRRACCLLLTGIALHNRLETAAVHWGRSGNKLSIFKSHAEAWRGAARACPPAPSDAIQCFASDLSKPAE